MNRTVQSIGDIMARQSAELRLEVNTRPPTFGGPMSAKPHLDASQLLKFDGRKFTTADIEGLGTVRLASLSARKGIEFEKLMKRHKAGEDVDLEVARTLMTGCIVDDVGAPVFDELTADRFLDRITGEIAGKLIKQMMAFILEQRPTTPEGGGNPSAASPTGA